MSEVLPDIVVLDRPIERAELDRLVGAHFTGMVKLVADLRRRLVALGGELHADAEALLLEQGSRQEDLWGANYYPGRGEEGCIEFTSLINIRPSDGNRGMLIEEGGIRDAVRSIVHQLVGRGEEH